VPAPVSGKSASYPRLSSPSPSRVSRHGSAHDGRRVGLCAGARRELAAKGTLTVIEMRARLAARRMRKGLAESRGNDMRQVLVLRRVVRS
jgi:hypothetical protein